MSATAVTVDAAQSALSSVKFWFAIVAGGLLLRVLLKRHLKYARVKGLGEQPPLAACRAPYGERPCAFVSCRHA